MLWLAMTVKLVCEVALLAALGRAVLGLLIGPVACGHNPFHRLLGWVVRPVERLAGRGTVPVLLLLWLAATAAKVGLCVAAGVQACR